MDPDATPVARRIQVVGRVQGVFFRASMRGEARRLGVVGWVRNLPDGNVEAWLEGPSDAVAALESWARRGGPSSAVVTDVEVDDVEVAGHDRFEVR